MNSQPTTSKSIRNSNIEILRIVSMFFILMSHALSLTAGSINYDGMGISQFSVVGYIFRVIGQGQLGNSIFIAISCFFLVDSKKAEVGKVANLILNTFVISMLFFVPYLIIRKGDIESELMVKSLLPFAYNVYWFITCYSIFYLIHPFINKILASLSKKQHLSASIILIAIYSVIQLFLVSHYYYTFLIGFIVYFVVIAYAKWHLTKLSASKSKNTIFLCAGIILYFFLDLTFLMIGKTNSVFYAISLQWPAFINPLYFLIAIPLINLCCFKPRKSSIINFVGGSMVYVYLFHENILFRTYTQPFLHSFITSNLPSPTPLFYFAYGVSLFISCICVSLLYRISIAKLISIVVEKTQPFFRMIMNWLLNKLTLIE